MIAFMRRLLRRVAAVTAVAFGALLAMLFAAITLTAALAIGAARWLSARFGLRARRSPAGPPSARDAGVIDVEMREIGPAAGNAQSEPDGEGATTRPAEAPDDGRRAP